MEELEQNGKKTGIPGAGSSYGLGWDVIWKTFAELLVVTLILGIIQIPANAFQLKGGDMDFQWYMAPILLFVLAYAVFISGPISYSGSWVFLKAVRKEKIEIKDMFAVFERNYWNAVLASLATTLIIVLGVLMLIVPGIIFACRLAFVPFLIIDEKMEVMDALKASWAMTRGQGWKIFGMALLAVLIVIAGLIMLFFGVIISAMWISAAFAVLYHAVYLEKGIPEENRAQA